jgi:leucyl-tRNA synthetase
MRDLGLIKNDEPVERLFTQGMVIKNGAKMSKSKGNVVSPDDMIARYGADATRMYSLFAAPPDRDLDWQEDGVAGVSRFLGKVYRFAMKHAETARDFAKDADSPHTLNSQIETDLCRKLHKTIRKITQDFSGRWHFNTSIAAIMELMNELSAADDQFVSGKIPKKLLAYLLKNLVRLLAPFAPYLAFELWEQLGHTDNILRTPWPKFDEGMARENEIEIPVQVNGKLRAVVKVPADTDQDTISEAVKTDPKVQAAIAGKEIVKAIVVPGKLVNIVVKG